jgi:hypothetical protein
MESGLPPRSIDVSLPRSIDVASLRSPGDTLLYSEYHFIRASPMDLVGFSVDLNIEGVGWRWKGHGDFLSTPKFPS